LPALQGAGTNFRRNFWIFSRSILLLKKINSSRIKKGIFLIIEKKEYGGIKQVNRKNY
jgi:hypothetical protein